MYCTGGVRCKRASALLKQKMEEEEDTKQLGIKGVFQLQEALISISSTIRLVDCEGVRNMSLISNLHISHRPLRL